MSSPQDTKKPQNHGIILVEFPPSDPITNGDQPLYIHLPAPNANIHTRSDFYKEKFALARKVFDQDPDAANMCFIDPVARLVTIETEEERDYECALVSRCHEDWTKLNDGGWPDEVPERERSKLSFKVHNMHDRSMRVEWSFCIDMRHGAYYTATWDSEELLRFIKRLDTTHLPCTTANPANESSSPSTQTPENEDHHPES